MATIVWTLTWWRQHPCQQVSVDDAPDPFLRLCYSDIPVTYQGSRLWEGARVYSQVTDLEYPMLTGGFMTLARTITGWFGLPIKPELPLARVLASANAFFAVNAVLLFACLLLLVGCQMLMGRGSATGVAGHDSGSGRSWDAMFVVTAPTLFTAGLVSWDLFGVAHQSGVAVVGAASPHRGRGGAGAGGLRSFLPARAPRGRDALRPGRNTQGDGAVRGGHPEHLGGRQHSRHRARPAGLVPPTTRPGTAVVPTWARSGTCSTSGACRR